MNNKKTTLKMISLMSRKSLNSSRMRNIFVMITIILASALLLAILMFSSGQKEQTKKQLSHRQHAGYYNLTKEQVENLKKEERITVQIQVKMGILSELDGFDVMPYYVSELSEQIQIGELESGRLPEAENEIAVQAAMLQKMGINPSTGSSVTLSFYDGSTETFLVSGILKGSDTAKQFPVFFSESYAQNGSQLKDSPYEVYARISNAEHMDPEECKETMYSIGSDAGIERKYVSPSKAFLDSLSLSSQKAMLYVLVGGVILFACFLVIYGVFYLSVIGRIHQFGQLRTIGMTKKQLKKLVSREGRMLFFASAPVGIVIGILAGYFMIPDGFQLLNTVMLSLLVLVIVYLITMVSVHKPAKIAASVSPMEALRYVPQDGMKQKTNTKLCRRLSPFGLGAMNFSKNKKKAAITMLSLALGGILFMTAATYLSSFDKAAYARQGYFTNAEFHIQYSNTAVELDENGMSGLQAKSPLTGQIIDQISALDGVETITQVKNFGVKYDYPAHDEFDNHDTVLPLSEEDLSSMDQYLEDGSADYDKLMSGDYVLVADNDNVKEIFGWAFDIGDKINLHYFDGSQMTSKEVTILGSVNDQFVLEHSELDGWFLMPEQVILNMVSYDSLNAHLLVTVQPDKETEIGEQLEQIISERPELELETLAERRITYASSVNKLFGAISGLAIFIMLFSILSMMNTLITNIVTRKQELAMLESIGMSRKQLHTMLLGESLLLALATVGVTMTVGTLCGYALSTVLYNAGSYYMAFQFPTVFSLAYAGVLILVPLLITFLSMHNFSKEALVERLRGAEG